MLKREEIDLEFIINLAPTLVQMMKKQNIRICIGCDESEMGSLISKTLACSFNNEGVDVYSFEKISSGCVCFAIKELKLDLGIMIFFKKDTNECNIKIFNGSAFIISKEQEDYIEYFLQEGEFLEKKSTYKIGKTINNKTILTKYLQKIAKIIEIPLNKKELAVLVKNEEQYLISKLFKDINLKYKIFNNKNISKCEFNKYNYVVEFDEDYSQVKFYTKDRRVDEEVIAYLLSCREENILMTENANIRLEQILDTTSIRHLCVRDSGEYNVVSKMLENEFSFGFEDNLYYFTNHSTSADALVTLMKVLNLDTKLETESKKLLLNPTKELLIKNQIVESNDFKSALLNCESSIIFNGRILFKKYNSITKIKIETESLKLTNEIYDELSKFIE